MQLKDITKAAHMYGWRLPMKISDKTWQEVIKARPVFEETAQRLSLVLTLATQAVKKAPSRRFIPFQVPADAVRLESYELFIGLTNKAVIIAQVAEAAQIESLRG